MTALRPVRIAVIDIGTNSVKLLVADINGDVITPVSFHRETPRIGAGIGRAGRIDRDATGAAVDVVGRFVRAAKRARAVKTVAFSTWALRKARNASEVVRTIERDAGVAVRVLSGREEAFLAHLSARHVLPRSRPYTLTFDIGGGSTELVLGSAEKVTRWSSLPLGALTLTERFIHSDPIDSTEFESLRHHVEHRLSRWFDAATLPAPPRLDLVASGGTVTTARAMSAPGSGAGPLTLGALRRLEDLCLTLTVAQRKRLRGLPADRADIMPAGIAVALAILRLSNKRVLNVSAGGVREGVLIHLSRNDLEW